MKNYKDVGLTWQQCTQMEFIGVITKRDKHSCAIYVIKSRNSKSGDIINISNEGLEFLTSQKRCFIKDQND